MSNWQPELFEGTYPTGRYTIQTNDRYGHDERRQDWAEKTIAEINRILAEKPKRERKPRQTYWTANGVGFPGTLPMPKRAPKYIGPSLANRSGQGALITETIGGEHWGLAFSRMKQVAEAIGWGWSTHPGDYIPRDMAEVHAMQREPMAAA